MRRAILIALGALFAPASANAFTQCTSEVRPADDVTPSLTFLAENDMFNGTNDRNYTSGLQASFISKWRLDPCVEDLLDRLTPTSREQGWTYGVGLTNQMFTPEDLTLPEPVPDDRPYAGVTALTLSAFTFNRPLGENDPHDQRSFDEVAISLGAIGPASGADDLQSAWHHSVLHIGTPAGWDTNQVDSAFLFQLDYQHTGDVDAQRQHGLDFTWNYGFGAGTFMNYAHAGAGLRLGVNMSGDIGPPRIAPGPHGSGFWQPEPDGSYLGGYVFVGVDQRYIAYDHTLDEHPSAVDRREWVADAHWGWVVHAGGMRLSGVYVWREQQFRGQPEADSFGAYSVTFTSCWECYSLWNRRGDLRPLLSLNRERPRRELR
jgi:lipid A 3-O-deacylase